MTEQIAALGFKIKVPLEPLILVKHLSKVNAIIKTRDVFFIDSITYSAYTIANAKS